MTAPVSGAAPATELTILIADDHWVVRESLKQVASSLGENIRTEEAASFDKALDVLQSNPAIGLLLVDLIMPGFKEFDGLRMLRRQYPAIPVVVISIHEDPDYVLRAIQNGVVGYIPKSATAEEIKRALSRVIAGEVAFPREILARVQPEAREAEPLPAAEDAGLTLLTSREGAVMAMLGQGNSLFDIAEALEISRQTVRVHLGNAMKKLDVSTREGAIRFAVENADALGAQFSSNEKKDGAKNGAG